MCLLRLRLGGGEVGSVLVATPGSVHSTGIELKLLMLSLRLVLRFRGRIRVRVQLRIKLGKGCALACAESLDAHAVRPEDQG